MIATWAFDLLLTAAICGAIAFTYRLGFEAGWSDGIATARRNQARKEAERI